MCIPHHSSPISDFSPVSSCFLLQSQHVPSWQSPTSLFVSSYAWAQVLRWFSFHSLLLHTCTPSTLGFNDLQQQSVSKGSVINHQYVRVTKPVAIVTGKPQTKLKNKKFYISPNIAQFHKCPCVFLCLIVSPPSPKHSEIKVKVYFAWLKEEK